MKIVDAVTWPLREIDGLQRFGYRLVLEPEEGDRESTETPPAFENEQPEVVEEGAR